MLEYSQAVEKTKKILYKQLQQKAIHLSNWSIEVDKTGQMDALYASQLILADSIRELNSKYLRFLNKNDILIFDAFLSNRKYFPETYIDIEYADDIKLIIEYLMEYYPEKFL